MEIDFCNRAIAWPHGHHFGTILADPPWQFQNRTGKIAPEHIRAIHLQVPQQPPVNVAVAVDAGHRHRAAVEQRVQLVGRFIAELRFVGAARRVRFGGVDAGIRTLSPSMEKVSPSAWTAERPRNFSRRSRARAAKTFLIPPPPCSLPPDRGRRNVRRDA